MKFHWTHNIINISPRGQLMKLLHLFWTIKAPIHFIFANWIIQRRYCFLRMLYWKLFLKFKRRSIRRKNIRVPSMYQIGVYFKTSRNDIYKFSNVGIRQLSERCMKWQHDSLRKSQQGCLFWSSDALKEIHISKQKLFGLEIIKRNGEHMYILNTRIRMSGVQRISFPESGLIPYLFKTLKSYEN